MTSRTCSNGKFRDGVFIRDAIRLIGSRRDGSSPIRLSENPVSRQLRTATFFNDTPDFPGLFEHEFLTSETDYRRPDQVNPFLFLWNHLFSYFDPTIMDIQQSLWPEISRSLMKYRLNRGQKTCRRSEGKRFRRINALEDFRARGFLFPRALLRPSRTPCPPSPAECSGDLNCLLRARGTLLKTGSASRASSQNLEMQLPKVSSANVSMDPLIHVKILSFLGQFCRGPLLLSYMHPK